MDQIDGREVKVKKEEVEEYEKDMAIKEEESC